MYWWKGGLGISAGWYCDASMEVIFEQTDGPSNFDDLRRAETGRFPSRRNSLTMTASDTPLTDIDKILAAAKEDLATVKPVDTSQEIRAACPTCHELITNGDCACICGYARNAA